MKEFQEKVTEYRKIFSIIALTIFLFQKSPTRADDASVPNTEMGSAVRQNRGHHQERI